MLNLIDPPCSQDILVDLYKKALAPTSKNISTTLVSFPGGGKTLQIKYVINNLSSFTENTDFKQLFMYMDLEHYLSDTALALNESLLFLKNYSERMNIEEIVKIMNDTKKYENSADYLELTNKLTGNGYQLTFLLNSIYLLFKKDIASKKLIDLLVTIRKINTSKINFIFSSIMEFDKNDISKLGPLSNLFVQNFVFCNNHLYDKESTICHLRYQNKHANAQFDENLAKYISTYCFGDPTLTNLVTNKFLANSELLHLFEAEKSIEVIYKALDEDLLNHRFEKIITRLKKESINYLKNPNVGEPTDYLINSGLVTKKGKSFKLQNPLLAYYCENYLAQSENNDNDHGGAKTHDTLGLSGQETLLLKLFESNLGKLVTKDEIAKSMWGQSWESKYSDWAVDQAISRLRNKIEAADYDKKLKTVKGQGVVLV